ncbi:hypothetical protein C5167_023353 [Papaver somniferum]|uniref:MalT-like TPR region domain-containing protein n=1 Tax=Papaver somniferum TaxID=3469 RepID=A0A4Y7JKI8_PAPSO|nr:protein KINESIN LIGHT CHAIN-RELATED 3-like [Papaver somniferum]RZC61614.1 hypothetical protein C5167_023353 [Papaver somniferum]
MPGIVNDVGVNGDEVLSSGNRTPPFEENSVKSHSPMNPQSTQSEGYGTPMDDGIDTSIQHLYDNVCDMQSSDQSPSRASFGSDGDESRIDSELRHLVGGEMREVEIMEEEIMESGSVNNEKAGNSEAAQSLSVNSVSSPQSKGNTRLSLDATQSPKSSPRSKGPRLPRKSIAGILSAKKQRSALGGAKAQNGTDDPSSESVNNTDLGPFLLKQARDLIFSGDNPQKALEFALRAAKSFEKCSNGSPSLELVMSLHVVAAIHCNLGQYDQAIKILERSIEIPAAEENQDQALAKFAGHMQLGDTYAMTGQFENSLQCYKLGLGVQKQALGEMDPRVGETCRYLAEALVQALQFEEAEKLCLMALDIHKESGAPASLEEAADRRLMGLICDTKGDYEAALEHLVLASMAMVSNGQEMEVATVDCSIGDTYLSLSRYDEAVFAYQKALTVYKATKGENHPSVASVFVRLADLYNKTGKLRESKSYCENALRIYGKPIAGIPQEEIASGLTDVSAIYESMNEPEQALKLLKKALKIYANAPGHQSTIAGIEAQMGVMYYMLGNYSESYNSFKSAVTKLRVSGEKKSAFFGIALNQMGLACVQRYAINEAADLFEEARTVLEQEYGPYHPDTLGVYSNLAGTYDAMGRLEDAIGILEYVVGMREEKLGTANPDVDDEKRRLTELLKEAGRVRNRKARSLENLLDTNSHTVQKDSIKV